MRGLGLILAGQVAMAAPLFAAQPGAPRFPSSPYQFKNARLGMTVDQWRAVAIPPVAISPAFETSGPPQAQCSGDRVGNQAIEALLSPTNKIAWSKAEQSAKVVICRYMHAGAIDGVTAIWRAPLRFEAGYTAEVDFKFLDGRLYQIDVVSNAGALDQTVDLLVEMWGRPAKVVNDTVRSKSGAERPHTVQLWSRPTAQIRLEAPWALTYALRVEYTLTASIAKIRQIDAKLHPDDVETATSH